MPKEEPVQLSESLRVLVKVKPDENFSQMRPTDPRHPDWKPWMDVRGALVLLVFCESEREATGSLNEAERYGNARYKFLVGPREPLQQVVDDYALSGIIDPSLDPLEILRLAVEPVLEEQREEAQEVVAVETKKKKGGLMGLLKGKK